MNVNKGCMRMFSGQLVDPLNLTPDKVRLDDICYALGNICRYGGHCHCHYSVAEHTLDVMDRVQLATHDEEMELYAGLHDAAEAYIGDVPSPIKDRLNIGKVETPIQKTISAAFGLDWEEFSTAIETGVVKRYDLEAGDDERARLWSVEAFSVVASPRMWGHKLFRRIARLMCLRLHSTEEQLTSLGIFAGKL